MLSTKSPSRELTLNQKEEVDPGEDSRVYRIVSPFDGDKQLGTITVIGHPEKPPNGNWKRGMEYWRWHQGGGAPDEFVITSEGMIDGVDGEPEDDDDLCVHGHFDQNSAADEICFPGECKVYRGDELGKGQGPEDPAMLCLIISTEGYSWFWTGKQDPPRYLEPVKLRFEVVDPDYFKGMMGYPVIPELPE